MKLIQSLFKKPLVTKIIIIITLLAAGWFTIPKLQRGKSQKTQFQTTQVEKGILTVVVSASGQVTAGNSATVDTAASGVISKIFVENGQRVKAGDKIAQVDLDLVGKQRSASSLASYQNAKNTLETTKINYYTLRSDMLTKWKTYMDTAQSSTYANSDGSPKTDTRQLPQFISVSDDWLLTEAKYLNQKNIVSQAQTAVNSAWLSYQQSSPAVYAPISGTVTGLSLQVGSVLAAQSNSLGGSASQKIASIQTDASPTVQINLTQIDTPKVRIGNIATLTFDAFPAKTYTGKIVSIDTIGVVSSSVTTYPAVIKLDAVVADIFSNMTASANIITQMKDNILLVPSSAVQTNNGQSSIRIIKNGQMETINVETGLSSGIETEIISGLSEGDTVVTSIITSQGQSTSNQTRSPFSSFGGGGFRMIR